MTPKGVEHTWVPEAAMFRRVAVMNAVTPKGVEHVQVLVLPMQGFE
ncbi:hypothetical protein FRUB_10158 [Fimbriiglobus ruber]|uniref:Uncharacterized protein n=1 Tax=Fimbriiglobus ruber TaxID=1908690 RepID=A0A225DDJ8_9BACT|nr:hypothetical protein FRUB_10158 [Fimbriiglobus ruber]